MHLQLFVRVIIPPPQDLPSANMHSTTVISIRNPENHGSNLNQDEWCIFFLNLGFVSKYKVEITYVDDVDLQNDRKITINEK